MQIHGMEENNFSPLYILNAVGSHKIIRLAMGYSVRLLTVPTSGNLSS